MHAWSAHVASGHSAGITHLIAAMCVNRAARQTNSSIPLFVAHFLIITDHPGQGATGSSAGVAAAMAGVA